MTNKNTVFIDTETTGLDPITDELLQIAAVDSDGKTLLNVYLKPTHTNSWESAMAVNGITPELVSDCPTFDDLKDSLANLFRGRDVVAYNMAFDGAFLESVLVEANSLICAMNAYTLINGKRTSLIKAVAVCDPNFTFKAHDALGDTLACKVVWDYCQKVGK